MCTRYCRPIHLGFPHSTVDDLVKTSFKSPILPNRTIPLQSASASAAYTMTFQPSSSPFVTSLSTSDSSQGDRAFSTSAAIGIGFAVGVSSVAFLLSVSLLLYRRWQLHRTIPAKHYRQARLWKGFEPVTPNTARTTFTETKMKDIHLTEFPTPVAPAFYLSPLIEGGRCSSERWIEDGRWAEIGYRQPCCGNSSTAQQPPREESLDQTARSQHEDPAE